MIRDSSANLDGVTDAPRGSWRDRARPGLVTRLLAGAGVAGLLVGGGLWAMEPAHAATMPVQDVDLSWRVNDESGGGAYFGGCNFLVAGVVGDAGSSHVWAESEGLYSTQEGNVTITKPDAAGDQVQPTWATKSQTATGTNVTTGAGSTSGNQVNLAAGSGTVDVEANAASISWDGDFTIVYYGGMTYWSISDPMLTVENGSGTLTGTASGFGADLNDPSKWVTLAPATIELATFSGVEVTATGVSIAPDYAGVEIDVEADGPSGLQYRTKDGWGSFPQSWIDFNVQTGQAAYWYTSSGMADSKKPAASIEIAYATPDGAYVRSATPTRVPTGYADGVQIEIAGLDGRSGAVELRAGGIDGAPLPLMPSDATSVAIAADVAAGSWDVSGLPVGSHEFTAVVIDKSGAASAVELASPLRVDVVRPLGDAAPSDLALTPSTNQILASWSWSTGTMAGPPSSYRVDLYTGDSATGTPLESRSVESTSATFSGLTPDTAYTVVVTPVLAGDDGKSVTGQTKTTATSTQPPSPTPGLTENPDPAPDPDDETSSGATFYWGLSMEATSGAYYGGCNFLTAGRAPDKGSATPWSADDGMYASAAGNVTIIKPVGNSYEQASWTTKCQDRTGAAVSVQRSGSYTESMVRITDGVVTEGSDGSLSIRWTGAFSVAFYGGMTYWSATDPVLELDANGNGSVTATASGYGASMHDASKWVALDERTITLADLTGVDMTAAAAGQIVHTPDYLGVAYTGTGSSQGVVGSDEGTATGQAERTAANAGYWGSFPSSFVDFQNETGQFSYWFTSNGARDTYKPTLPMTISIDGAGAPALGGYNAAPAPNLNQTQPGGGSTNPGGSGGGAGGGGAAQPEATDAAGASTPSGANGTPEALATTGDGGSIHPGLLVAGGAGLLAVAAANWAIAMLIRRRLGLDPTQYA